MCCCIIISPTRTLPCNIIYTDTYFCLALMLCLNCSSSYRVIVLNIHRIYKDLVCFSETWLVSDSSYTRTALTVAVFIYKSCVCSVVALAIRMCKRMLQPVHVNCWVGQGTDKTSHITIKRCTQIVYLSCGTSTSVIGLPHPSVCLVSPLDLQSSPLSP